MLATYFDDPTDQILRRFRSGARSLILAGFASASPSTRPNRSRACDVLTLYPLLVNCHISGRAVGAGFLLGPNAPSPHRAETGLIHGIMGSRWRSKKIIFAEMRAARISLPRGR